MTIMIFLQVKAFCDMYEFRDLKFENEARDSAPAADAVETIVAVTLERKLKSAFKYDFIEEKIKLRRHTQTGVWSVVSSDMKIKPAHDAKMVRTSQDNSFIS